MKRRWPKLALVLGLAIGSAGCQEKDPIANRWIGPPDAGSNPAPLPTTGWQYMRDMKNAICETQHFTYETLRTRLNAVSGTLPAIDMPNPAPWCIGVDPPDPPKYPPG